MQYQVPQFIEIEDKIFGPLSFKQFVYLVGGGGATFAVWKLIPFSLIAIIFIVPIVIFAVALAFYKVNNKPFSLIVEAFFKYMIGSKLYLWRKKDKEIIPTIPKKTHHGGLSLPQTGESKLKDLGWDLDVARGDSNVESLKNK